MSESVCLKCEHKRLCWTGMNQPSENSTVTGCSRFERKKPRTNADRIRAMSDEEMAYSLAVNECGICPLKEKCFSMEPIRDCEDMWLDWLRQEADNAGT